MPMLPKVVQGVAFGWVYLCKEQICKVPKKSARKGASWASSCFSPQSCFRFLPCWWYPGTAFSYGSFRYSPVLRDRLVDGEPYGTTNHVKAGGPFTASPAVRSHWRALSAATALDTARGSVHGTMYPMWRLRERLRNRNYRAWRWRLSRGRFQPGRMHLLRCLRAGLWRRGLSRLSGAALGLCRHDRPGVSGAGGGLLS